MIKLNNANKQYELKIFMSILDILGSLIKDNPLYFYMKNFSIPENYAGILVNE